MSVITRLIVAISAVGALMVSIYNSTQIQEVHIMMNSRLSELLDLTRASSKAEGVKQGMQDEKDRVKK